MCIDPMPYFSWNVSYSQVHDTALPVRCGLGCRAFAALENLRAGQGGGAHCRAEEQSSVLASVPVTVREVHRFAYPEAVQPGSLHLFLCVVFVFGCYELLSR